MANRFIFLAITALMPFGLSAFSENAVAAMGVGNMVYGTQIPDQYQCSKNTGDDHLIDVILNGSQNFQGIARTQKGQLVEVAGVISDPYAVSIETKQEVDRAVENFKNGEWEVFSAELQLTNMLVAKKYKESGKADMSMMLMGGGMMGGFGMSMGGMNLSPQNSNENMSKDKEQTPNVLGGSRGMMSMAPGTSGGGGMFGMGFGFYGGPSMVSAEEAASIRRQATEMIKEKRKREHELQAERQRRAEYNKLYGPPPTLERPALPQRAGDQVASRAGDAATQAKRPGDLAAETKRPGDQVQARPGDNADTLRPGDEAGYSPKPGDMAMGKLRPGDAVPKAAGALIGTANSLTFTALIDPATGKVVRMIYRDENKPTQAMNYSGELKASDPIQGRVMQYVQRVQKYASCCQQDSKASCDQKYSPQAQEALKEFRKDTEEAIAATFEPGGAIFNPFAGRPAPRGAYGPATPISPAKSRGTNK